MNAQRQPILLDEESHPDPAEELQGELSPLEAEILEIAIYLMHPQALVLS